MKISMMTKNLRYRYPVFCLTIIFYVITLGPVVAAENLNAPSTTPPILEVVYDHETDLLSILARQTPLDKVLQEISKRVHLTIDSPNQELLREYISVEIKWLSLEQALKKVLEGFNSVFVYTAGSKTRDETTTPRLAKIRIFIFSREASMSPEALEELAKREEKEQAVEPSLKTVAADEIPTRPDAHAALEGLTPETAVAVLGSWLQGNDQQLRVFAAARLGELGSDRAISALSAVLSEDNSLIRQVAANSLAQITEEGGTRTLIAAYLEGDAGLKQAAATAIASYGDEMSQQALASLLGGGQASGGQTAREVIVQSLRRQADPD